MSQQYEKLKTLLKELFQLDQPELDFGLYRVMHAKSAEITRFLDHDLLPQVKAAFEQYRSADKNELESELAKAVEAARALGVDPETTGRVQELRGRLKTESVDLGALEREVYDHLYSFFRRYYSEGDFLAKRVYKPGVYAIPYEGEEVTLYWANKDQYYIKTSEYLRDYAFRLRPGDEKNPMRVHFRLVDAAEGEHGNVKAAEGKERRFKLAKEQPLAVENGELVIRFTYLPDPKRQAELNAEAERAVLATAGNALADWVAALGAPAPTDSDPTRTVLAKHLKGYSDRNTFDYFIHKDLGGFLRRELDFYIKNEVMHLDDVENETAPRVEQYLSTIKVVRRIAGKVIDFLAQLEGFQKKLWLKKKFVVETSYLVSVAQIPERLYPAILGTSPQIDEWETICRISDVQESGATRSGAEGRNGNTTLVPQLINANSTLLVDTKHLPKWLEEDLLDTLGNISAVEDGVLCHGDNFQALGTYSARYGGRVNTVYIDPPYNTDASAIDYKNGYKSSSWLALMSDRLERAQRLLAQDGVLIAAIDDEQQRELSYLLSDVFKKRNLGTMSVRSNPSGRPTQTGYAVSHEYMLFWGNGPDARIGRMPPTPEQLARFNQMDEKGPFEWRNLRREGSNSDRSARPALYYPIYINGSDIRIPAMTWDAQQRVWKVSEEPRAGEAIAIPTNDDGIEKTWRWEWQTLLANLDQVAVRPDRTGRPYVYVKRRPHEEGVVAVSSWFDARYSATEHGTAVLKKMFGVSPFSYPKSIHLVGDALYVGGAKERQVVVLDFFGGSGTTAHAVINANRADGGQRRFLLVEQNDYFDSVLVPRIKKVSFTPEWDDGKPVRRATPEEKARSPRVIRVLRLESYEDALNNLATRRSDKQQLQLDTHEAQGADRLKEQYTLRYMLDLETRGSQSLLNVRAFKDPTAYKLKVKRPGSDESREVNVDLLETFNWLIGLSVERLRAPQTVTAATVRDAEKRLCLKGALKPDSKGKWWFRSVSGTTPQGERALIIWRKRPGGESPEGIEEDNLVLDEWFKAQEFTTGASAPDIIWINGTNNLENLKGPGEGWRVRLIEEDFHRLMFADDAT